MPGLVDVSKTKIFHVKLKIISHLGHYASLNQYFYTLLKNFIICATLWNMCNKKVSFNKIPWLSLTNYTFPDFPSWWEPWYLYSIGIIIHLSRTEIQNNVYDILARLAIKINLEKLTDGFHVAWFIGSCIKYSIGNINYKSIMDMIIWIQCHLILYFTINSMWTTAFSNLSSINLIKIHAIIKYLTAIDYSLYINTEGNTQHVWKYVKVATTLKVINSIYTNDK